MDLRLTEEQQLLRVAVREFAEAEIRPNVMEWDEAQAFSMDLLPKLAAQGLMGIQVSEAYGGSEMSAVAYCVCIEELARVDPSIALSVAAHNGLCVAHLKMFGNDAQKDRYLRPLAAGQHLGAWGLTEASSGSDAAAMRTVATPRRPRLGAERNQAIHHPRPRRRHHRRDGRHGQDERSARHLGVRRSRSDTRGSKPARRKTSSACAPATRAK
jgi:hypothetical protein